MPVTERLPKHTKAGDATIRINVQAYVRPGTVVLNGQEMVRTAGQGRGRKYVCPDGIFCRVGPVGTVTGLNGCRRWKITGEMAGIDVKAANDARKTKPDDRVVVASVTPTLRFPAIDPLPVVRSEERRVGQETRAWRRTWS